MDTLSSNSPNPSAPSNHSWRHLKPVSLQDDTYRWTIGLFAHTDQVGVATEFEKGLRAAWPSRDELLSIIWLTDVQSTESGPYNMFAKTPCDLLFVFDDPAAPDEIDKVLRAAVGARHTPIRVTDPTSTTAPFAASALSWPVDPTYAREQAAAFAFAVFAAFLPEGKVCVDWQDLLALLDSPGLRLQITQCDGSSWDGLYQAFGAALASASPYTKSAGRLHATHMTIVDNGSLRMAQVRQLVTRQRLACGEDTWQIYAVPQYHSEGFYVFLLSITSI